MTNTIHLTLKMTSSQVVETSVTNNSSLQSNTHLDDHDIQTTDTPGFKPFTMLLPCSKFNYMDINCVINVVLVNCFFWLPLVCLLLLQWVL